jgi:hypothetical protein
MPPLADMWQTVSGDTSGRQARFTNLAAGDIAFTVGLQLYLCCRNILLLFILS